VKVLPVVTVTVTLPAAWDSDFDCAERRSQQRVVAGSSVTVAYGIPATPCGDRSICWLTSRGEKDSGLWEICWVS